jgi:NADPH-dependent glutamate synthase beta subunit-like oxidoreductase/NAD-dependent dihydropyrimidine dehydrogenase PreA subunit/coenzyme F420-reducing hydrogenase delta subunit
VRPAAARERRRAEPAAPWEARLDLAGTSLYVPTLAPQPQPLRAITPAPCTQACPAGVNVKAYVSHIAEGRFAAALEVVRRRCPLPGICGRICHHPCEAACKRAATDEAVAIRALKRFVADQERSRPPVRALAPHRPQRVAVVGSGPAGLTAAYDLLQRGYPVRVFEGEAEPGGMLRYGITPYRLPREVLAAEIEALIQAGVEIETGRRLGGDLELESLLTSHAAVLLAVGAQRGKPLALGGEGDGRGAVEDALSFLRRVNDGDRTPIAGRVAVVGGGSTAVEAARAALRLGASAVEVLYRRYREELLAAPEEIEAAEAEGIRFRFLVAPVRLLAPNGGTGLECVQVGLGEPDASGRRRPLRIPGSEFVVPADRVFAAVGQESDFAFLPPELGPRLTTGGRLLADAATAMTPLLGVFAAGDAVSGPATVIEAIAAGHRAAESIHHYLEEGRPGIREQRPERQAPVEYGLPDPPPVEAMRIRPRQRRPQPGREFHEVEKPFSARDAMAEARRCLRCGPCGECSRCAPSCDRRHVMLRVAGGDGALGPSALLRVPAGVALGLPVERSTAAFLLPAASRRARAAGAPPAAASVGVLPLRARIEPDLCRACGRCVEVCPFGAIDLADSADGRASIDPALCRGCHLCTAVCPTGAAVASTLSPEWWGARLGDLFQRPASERPLVVLACQRRAGALEKKLLLGSAHVEVVRLRCVGQATAGMLVDLCGRGARRVLLAGCRADRCRFDQGAKLAAAELRRAAAVLAALGRDPTVLVADWSAGREQDPLDLPVLTLLQAGAGEGPAPWRRDRP